MGSCAGAARWPVSPRPLHQLPIVPREPTFTATFSAAAAGSCSQDTAAANIFLTPKFSSLRDRRSQARVTPLRCHTLDDPNNVKAVGEAENKPEVAQELPRPKTPKNQNHELQGNSLTASQMFASRPKSTPCAAPAPSAPPPPSQQSLS